MILFPRIHPALTASLIVAATTVGADAAGEKSLSAIADEQFTFAAQQYDGMLRRIAGDQRLPRTFDKGQLQLVGPRDWTSGFFPGALWLIYEQTREPRWKEAAADYTKRLEPVKHYAGTHDLGFMLYCSYGQGFRLTKDPAYRDVLIAGARTLSTRFNLRTGLIRSWDWGDWKFPVIVDNMMNLEFLIWANTETKEASFRDIAVSHANKTLQNHFRPDYSSWHVLDYDPETGTVLKRQTHQGYSDDSAWARGQAWGLYGFVVMHRATSDGDYLAQAKKIADFLVNHPRLPADKVPYWDFDAPKIPNEPRDASAAAVMASALLELSRQTDAETGRRYRAVAEQQLRSLASPAYRARLGENGHFLIMHCVGNRNSGVEVDAPLSYADYYFLEALARYRAWFGAN